MQSARGATRFKKRMKFSVRRFVLSQVGSWEALLLSGSSGELVKERKGELFSDEQ